MIISFFSPNLDPKRPIDITFSVNSFVFMYVLTSLSVFFFFLNCLIILITFLVAWIFTDVKGAGEGLFAKGIKEF